MEDLFELVGVKEAKKRLRCLVCDKWFMTTASWRTCPRCKDNEADREKRQYGETPRKW